MPSSGRDLSRPLTVVNRFTVKGDTRRFERQFRPHCDYLRQQRGFNFLVTGQLIDRPNVYMHFSHWVTHQAFLRVVHHDAFLSHVQGLSPIVEVEADQAVSLGRLLVDEARQGAENVVFIQALVDEGRPLTDFEWQFHELFGHCAAGEGFGGGDVMRSTLAPQKYLAVCWWRDGESCQRAMAEPGFLQRVGQLKSVARISTERLRHLTYAPGVSR
ncbi:hypothetical protein PJ985_18570 [Streptomyces sp. ACA25]|uniref:antibiotic biosynthesis monooxygenase family protein n=1 Tax=Streptomyces sp. ACA25 TaxID=3022596 RepID=UPI002307036B|nr:antibiotic biosynthesis monooxygenase [Streptomyces sp. ACA25]MDB1089567.1 hypothetical protein [Streptomyces sp. ACA25]